MDTPAAAEWRARAKRVALIASKVLGVLVALICLVVGGTMTILETRWGGERLRRQAVKRVNAQIQGRLEIGRLSFEGNRLVVWGIVLRDPEVRPVVEVARFEVGFKILALLRKNIHITGVVIDRPRLDVLSDSRGSNLSRATAARKRGSAKAPPKQRTEEEGWVLLLDRLEMTGGELTVAAGEPGPQATRRVHIAEMRTFMHARYALGNGSMDAALRFGAESRLAPVGPIRLSAKIAVHGTAVGFDADGEVLGGTIKARGSLDTGRLADADVLVAIAIPAVDLVGYRWGPLRIDAEAHPGRIPTAGLSLVVPGIELTGKGGGTAAFTFDGRLAASDLELTRKSLQALTGSELPPMSGRGDITFSLGGPMASAPASWSAHAKGAFDRIRVADVMVRDFAMKASATRLIMPPAAANVDMSIASVTAGTTDLRAITFGAQLREQILSAEVKIAAPEPFRLATTGRLDDDQHGLAIKELSLVYPGAEWRTDRPATVRFEGETTTLEGFRLVSKGQSIAADATKSSDELKAHLVLENLRLDLLPAFAVGPSMHLGGILDAM